MSHPIFYRPEMAVAGQDPYFTDTPYAFVAMARSADLAKRVKSFRPAKREDLGLVHDMGYIQGVFKGSIHNGVETYDPQVVRACLHRVGSMVAAAREAWRSGQSACSPVSGIHLAGYASGDGLNTFNGLMVAAATILLSDPNATVGIPECDMHHGQGTQDILEHRPELAGRICYLSSHRYFQGEPSASSFFGWLRSSITLLNAAQCAVVFYQAGADMHLDSLKGGLLTTCEMAWRDHMVFTELRCGVAWNLAGGDQTHPGAAQQGLVPALSVNGVTLQQATRKGVSSWCALRFGDYRPGESKSGEFLGARKNHEVRKNPREPQ